MSLTLRLTLTYLLVTLSGLLLLGGAFMTLMDRYTAQQRERELAAQADVYTSYVAELARTPAELQSFAPSLSASGVLPAAVTVRIFSTGGTLLSDAAGLGPFPSRPVLALVSGPLPLPISQVSDRRYVARLIPGNGAALGIIELSHTTVAEARLHNALRTLVLQAALVAGLLTTLISLVAARSIARPITRLTRRADALASSDPHTAAQLLNQDIACTQSQRNSRDEMRVLAHSLDRMAGQLQARIAETESERARLAVVLATISEGVVALDVAGDLLFANPAAATLLGVETDADIVPRLVTLGVPRHTSDAVEHEVHPGQRQLLIIINPVGTPAHASEGAAAEEPPGHTQLPPRVPATVLVIRDITRLTALEQARTRFFRSISHDLRTPLTAIRGMLENLHDDAPPEQQAAFDALEDETARLARLVDALLHPPADGALLPAERRPVNLGVLASELCALQQGRARRAGINLTCHTQPDLPPVYGDRDRLKQAVLNLLDNALQVTPAGGIIRVQVDPVRSDLNTDEPRIQLTVADSGPGIPPELRERIWERGIRGVDLNYAQPDAGYGGTGLGLAIVREIATAHGGQAWAEENIPHGARFVLDLPAATGAIMQRTQT